MLQLQRPCFASTRIRAETVVIAQLQLQQYLLHQRRINA